MSDNAAVPDFDWVKARAECSVESMFRVLSEQVDSDAKAANAARGAKMLAVTLSHTKAIVASPSGSIVLELSGGDIIVRSGPDRVLFVARPALTEDGECLFEIGGQLLKSWQLRRRALEDLFFR